MGKGSKRRPCLEDRRKVDLRWDLAMGKITRAKYDARMKELERQK